MAINKRKILESAQKHLQKGALDKALEDYQTLVKADPKDANIRLKLGDLQLKLGRTDEAINAYLKVAKQFTGEGFDAKAVALYKQVTKLDAKRHEVYAPLAELYQRMGLSSDAMKALQTAADAAHRSGDKAETLTLLRKMAALDPSNTTNRLKVADLLHQEGQTPEALSEYEAVVAELERQGADEERLRAQERMLELAPDRADLLEVVTRGMLAAANWSGAERGARRLLSLDAASLDARKLLGQALEGAGREDESSVVMHELADRYRERGDDDQAREIMQRYVGLRTFSGGDTGDPEPLGGDDEIEFDAAPSNLSNGADDDFLGAGPGRAADEAVRDDSGDSNLLETAIEDFPVARAAPAARAGPPRSAPRPAPAVKAPPRPSAAREPLAAAPLEIPPDADPEQLLAEAGVYIRYNKPDRAVLSLRGILAREPEHRAALTLIADAFAALGKDGEAAASLQRAAELAARDEDADAFGQLRARLAAIDPSAAEALAGPAAVPTDSAPEDDVAIDFDIDIDSGLDEETAAPSESEERAGVGIEFDAADLEVSFGDEAMPEVDAPGEDIESAPEAALEPRATSRLPSAAAKTADRDDSQTAGALPEGISEDLEAADFFFSTAMLAEARDAYLQILVRAPHHPRASLRVGEIDVALAEAGDAEAESEPSFEPPRRALAEPSETRDLVSDAGDAADDPAGARFDDSQPSLGEGFDLEEPVLEETPEPEAPLLAAAEPTAAVPQLEWNLDAEEPPAVESEPAGDFDLAAQLTDAFDDALRPGAGGDSAEEEAFAEVFAAFKQGVESELGDGDHEAHYDLGIAYREMGLLDDAIAEFRKSMQAPERQLSSLHMMGICALDLGRAADACAHIQQALAAGEVPADQRMALQFDLGRAYAASGDVARARECFEAVRAQDAQFCDVAGQLAALVAPPAAGERAAPEAFESFDDLLAEESPRRGAAPSVDDGLESFLDLMGDDEAEAEPSFAEPSPPSSETRAPKPAANAVKRRKKISFV